MKITPLDVQQWDFRVSFRGYDRNEVAAFLGSVSQTLEELIKENAELKERAEITEGELNGLRKKEAALNDLLVTTQEMAETLKQAARREADLIMKETELKAEDLLKNAQIEYGALQREIVGLQRQRVVALEKFRAMLQTLHKAIELEELDQDSLSGNPTGQGQAGDRYESG